MSKEDKMSKNSNVEMSKNAVGSVERKIRLVKFYQSVEFQGKQLTHIVPDPAKSSGIRTDAEPIQLQKTPVGILVQTSKDCVEVFNTNIAYVAYEK